jgi:hypothetical protein
MLETSLLMKLDGYHPDDHDQLDDVTEQVIRPIALQRRKELEIRLVLRLQVSSLNGEQSINALNTMDWSYCKESR